MVCTARWNRAALAFALVLAAATPGRAQTTDNATVFEPAYADAIRSINPAVRRSQSRQYARALLSSAHRMGVDPNLVMAVVTVESHWNIRAVSTSGARGLGQFLPGTAHDLGVDTRSAGSNLRGVTSYLHELLGLFKSSRDAMREAIASYNAGPYTVRHFGVPAHGETPRYVVKVLSTWHSLTARLGVHPRIDDVALVLDEATRVDAQQNAYWGAR